MLNKCIRFLLIFTSCCVTSFAEYTIPEPKIEVFAEGFRVSIPDSEGIKIFSFHGNINVPLAYLKVGQFSADITKKKDDHWVFEETQKELKVGDTIYYWLFVQRFNTGYRDNNKFVVKEIVPYTSFKNISFEVSDSWNQQIPLVPTDSKPTSTCYQLFLNTSSQNALLSSQIDKLTKENKILIEIAQRDDHYARSLRVFGKYPSEYYPTPHDFVQTLVSEKLRLVGVKVLEAKRIPENGVSFKVETIKDKVNIILAAQENLKGTNYELSW